MLLFLEILLLIACHEVVQERPVDLASCPAALATLPDSAETADAQRNSGVAWTNRDIRVIYVCRAAGIGALDAGWQAEGVPVDERARRAYQVRHEARMTARAMMSDRAEVADLEARDTAKYGRKDGPSFEYLLNKGRAEGLSGDALYQSIIDSAQRTNEATNRALGVQAN